MHISSIIITTPKNFRLAFSNLKNLITAKNLLRKNQIQLSSVILINNLKNLSSLKKYQQKLNQLNCKYELIYSVPNKGFANAVNDAAVLAKFKYDPEWFLVINDDAYVKENFFKELLPYLKNNKFAVLSTTVETKDGSIESCGLNYQKFGLAFPNQNLNKKTDLFCGTSFLFSKKMLDYYLKKDDFIFNPLYFAYAEDLELSLRLRKDNFKVKIINNPLVVHLGSRTAKRASFFQLFHGYRNLLYTMILHWPISKILFNILPILFGQLYIIGICIYKGYFLLYPKLVYHLIKNWPILVNFRKRYVK